ncbi:hypothetical protein [Microbacterium sp.]|uniref:hypothetical protein n=1 Tax=Microbacterium sp. TaxID=51671 RepID=UPI002E2EBA5C|nr:hypothetical protein [Microbacterium sp.]HEX5730512.1 hypothetical protein [Microbacterium sp.]
MSAVIGRAALAAGTVIAGLLLAPAAAWASSDTEAGPGTAVFAVEVTDVSTGPNGAGETESTSGELRIACVGTTCAIASEPGRQFLGGIDLTAGATISGSGSSGSTGSPCAGGRGARTVSLDATAAGFTAELSQEPIEWLACDDGSEAYGHAREVAWSGTLVSADECVFREEGCAQSTGGSFLATGSPAAPSVLSTLATPATAGTAPVQLGFAAALTIILVLLVAFPTALLNSAAEHGSGRLADWWRARPGPRSPRGAAAAAEDAPGIDASEHPPVGRWSQTWWWAAVGVLAAAVISAFVDPQFGLNPGSARMVLSILASFGIDVVLGWVIVIFLMRRFAPGAVHSFAFQPLTLLIVVLAVVFTRITGFEPGIVFGLVAGVAFGALVGRAQEARATLVTLGYAFGVALIAWVLYGMMGGGAASGGSFWSTFTVETLSSVAIGGMAALPIALFPVRGLPGSTIWAWNRGVWAGCYAVGLFAFFVVLMPMPFSWSDVALDLGTWIGIYLVYLAVALVLWLLLARPWSKGQTVAPEVSAAAGGEPGEVGATVSSGPSLSRPPSDDTEGPTR